MGRRKGSLNKSTIAKMKMLEEVKIVQDKNTTPISLSKEEEGISVQTTTEQPDWTERSNSVGRPKKDSKIKETLCQRCKSPIASEPRKIDLNAVTGVAEYHRVVPRYIKLCNACTNELSLLVQNFLIDENGGNSELNRFYLKGDN